MQGFNMGRYVPPELEGTKSANQVAGKHPLGSRARKGNGILTVRFEMPFAVWCDCSEIIGQGVRFNAEKKKAGAYHSTPIWAFRMKHFCGGWIEIRTDPKNTDYVVFDGGKRRDTGVADELRTEAEKRHLREDAFAALEVTIEDRKQADVEKARIEELYGETERWEDPYAMNKRLRRSFRQERKEIEKKQAASEDLKARMGLGFDVAEETEEDRQRAAEVEFVRDARRTRMDVFGERREKPVLGVKRKVKLVDYDSD